jgi:hypothetical protein
MYHHLKHFKTHQKLAKFGFFGSKTNHLATLFPTWWGKNRAASDHFLFSWKTWLRMNRALEKSAH